MSVYHEGWIGLELEAEHELYTLCMIHRILYAASIDVNDMSLYILFASVSSGDRKHANTCVLEYNVQIILIPSNLVG